MSIIVVVVVVDSVFIQTIVIHSFISFISFIHSFIHSFHSSVHCSNGYRVQSSSPKNYKSTVAKVTVSCHSNQPIRSKA